MKTLRYHNRNAEGDIFQEFFISEEGRFFANDEMGFVEVPDTPAAKAHMKTLHLEVMEGEPQIPVALADPRLLEQHAQSILALEARIEELRAENIAVREELITVRHERDRAFADKRQILEKYDVAVTRLAGQEPPPKPPRKAP
jgi:hypothetical protein